MHNYKITIAYDGTKYRGWQVQKDTDLTIQGKLQNVLFSLAKEPVEVIGSGRTDTGVHAVGQVANFHMNEIRKEDGTLYEAEDIKTYLNRFLPEDIAVTKIEKAEERFHSRYHAISKTYRYRIHTDIVPNVFERKYVYTYLDENIDLERMKEASQYLLGEHDFAGFCGNRKMKKSTVRIIYAVDIEKKNGEITIDYTGNGFLQNMVRILTGTLIEIGTGRMEPSQIAEIIRDKNRDKAGYTAPAQGLTLMRVTYGEVGSNK